MPSPQKRKRDRGEVAVLPSGSLRVRVYAGVDPVTGKRLYLTETVPAGPRAAKEAEKVRTRFLAEVDEQRNPRTTATVGQLLKRYLEVLEIEPTTRNGYARLVRLYIEPTLGAHPLGRINGETVDSLYAELRRCRTRCDRKARIDHWTEDSHVCDGRCRQHRCRPLSGSYLRQIHSLLNGAFTRAVKWRWVGVNPLRQADAPPQPPADPQPPSSAQAAQIVSEAWRDPDWGMFVWLAMTTGARRGELCALRWDRIDFADAVMTVRSSIAQVGNRVWEKDTKTHQQRRIVLDAQTLSLLRAFLQHAATRASALNAALPDNAFVFSRAPDGSSSLKPDSVTQRYDRMCKRIGWDMHIHQLRHYSATELIAAGVDIRTVAGRLGHSGGGSTTLRVYTAWVAEADQRAATALSARMPQLVIPLEEGEQRSLPAGRAAAEDGSAAPYQLIATDLRAAIRCGALQPGDALPSVKMLAERYRVGVATAHRAIALLDQSDEIDVRRGRRAVVASRDIASSTSPSTPTNAAGSRHKPPVSDGVATRVAPA